MNQYEIDKLMNSITRVFEKHTGKEYNTMSLSVKKTVHQYSNTKTPIYRLYFEDQIIINKNSFAVEYKCVYCQSSSIVSLNNIKRKINKGMKRCIHCIETDEKIQRQKHFGEDLRQGKIKTKAQTPKQNLTISEKLKESEIEFENEDDDFKDLYFRKHLTISDFERIRTHIISIQNGVITEDYFKKLVYYPVTRIYNQTKYSPYMYDETKDILIKINYITYKCDSCQSSFTNRDLFVQKNKLKILCQDCHFCNRSFSIRHIKNAFGESLHYQSKYELKFVKYCNDNRIRVVNGPKIQYIWNNVSRNYIVDFFIPELNLLVELKDMHHWHMENIKNGKWKLKEQAAKEYCEKNNMTFRLIYSKNYTKECLAISRLISSKALQIDKI